MAKSALRLFFTEVRMSHNNWETQPRKADGEFTFRRGGFWNSVLKSFKESIQKNSDDVADFSKGGSYYELRKETKGNKELEVHHMPANSVSPLSRGKGPCVIMEKEDHAKTASYGGGVEADEYRLKQQKLIENGNFIGAEILDILDLFENFGSKYAKAILEKLEYDKQLARKGEIDD